MRIISTVIVIVLTGAGAARAQVAAPAVKSLMGHGISRELARARARAIGHVRYALHLDVASPDSAVGEVEIRFTRRGSGSVIVDFRGRRLTALTVNGATSRDVEFNGNHLRIPAASLRPGRNVLQARFVSEIAPSGASIIRIHDPSDGSTYLYTLLVPADANQLFPCFDQPDLKARVTFTLTTPESWTALANGSLVRADSGGGRVTWQFTETPPLSTYLVAFAAGPWTERRMTRDGRTIGLYVRRSRAAEAEADTLLTLAHRALGWMESYFGRAYPFEKFDVLLAPAFPFGGMEHPGVVMFNEDRFIFRERPTLARRLGRFSTVLHEVAHQWFGDLVTMEWFDDLWLKEGFATYMAAKALADLEPGSEAWKTFYQSNKPAAYGVDETMGTTPLWQEMANLDQAKSAYGAIVYNKAPAVLKQLNFLVGEPAFRRGVRAFLADHAYANAGWRDLLASVGNAAGRSLDAFGRTFMLRAGMPVVEPRVVTRNGRITRIDLEQRAAQPALSGTSPWPMRTQVLVAWPPAAAIAPVRIPIALTGRVSTIPGVAGRPAPLFVFPNADDYGYFVSLLDTATVRALEAGALTGVSDRFLRSMLWGALWDQVRDARMSPARFVRLVLRELPAESDEQILPSVLGRLERALRAYLEPDEAASLRADAEYVLWDGSRRADRAYGVRRAFLDAFVTIAASDDGRARLKTLLEADSAAGEPVRDPTRWSVVERLLVLADPDAERLLAIQTRRDTTPDGRRRAFVVGAARQNATTKAAYFQRYFADSTLNEDWASGSLGAFNPVEHQTLTLLYLRAALDSLPFIQSNRRIFFLGSWLGAFLGGQTSPEALGIVHRFLDDHPGLPADLRQKVLQNSDELERVQRIRAATRTGAHAASR